MEEEEEKEEAPDLFVTSPSDPTLGTVPVVVVSCISLGGRRGPCYREHKC